MADLQKRFNEVIGRGPAEYYKDDLAPLFAELAAMERVVEAAIEYRVAVGDLRDWRVHGDLSDIELEQIREGRVDAAEAELTDALRDLDAIRKEVRDEP